MVRANVLVVPNQDEAAWVKRKYPQFRFHVVVTPTDEPSGFCVGKCVWSPGALNLPARVRLSLRGLLAPLVDEKSSDEQFPQDALLSW